MKRSFTIILIALLSFSSAIAQQDSTASRPAQIAAGEVSSIYGNDNSDSLITAHNGRLSFSLNGIHFGVNGEQDGNATDLNPETRPIMIGPYKEESMGDVRVRFGLAGICAPSFNHFALIELGTNMLVNTDYSAYTPEEASALMFGNYKSVNCNINLLTINAPLNRTRSLVASMAFGFAYENYTFANPATMEFRDGMMRPVMLDQSIKKSKLRASYIHIPVVLDWNIRRGFFISAGFNFDILMSSALKYKFPKTKIRHETGLAPIQAGVTARIGWNRLYAYFNYSLVDMYRHNVGPRGHRLSAGVGFSF